MHKYEHESKKMGKQSFMFAWVLDETGEERTRGITMDCGYQRFETKTKQVVLLDAPGHKGITWEVEKPPALQLNTVTQLIEQEIGIVK